MERSTDDIYIYIYMSFLILVIYIYRMAIYIQNRGTGDIQNRGTDGRRVAVAELIAFVDTRYPPEAIRHPHSFIFLVRLIDLPAIFYVLLVAVGVCKQCL